MKTHAEYMEQRRQTQQALTTRIVEALALQMGVSSLELGQQWFDYAAAVAEVACTHKVDDKAALGGLMLAAVRLP